MWSDPTFLLYFPQEKANTVDRVAKSWHKYVKHEGEIADTLGKNDITMLSVNGVCPPEQISQSVFDILVKQMSGSLW